MKILLSLLIVSLFFLIPTTASAQEEYGLYATCGADDPESFCFQAWFSGWEIGGFLAWYGIYAGFTVQEALEELDAQCNNSWGPTQAPLLACQNGGRAYFQEVELM